MELLNKLRELFKREQKVNEFELTHNGKTHEFLLGHPDTIKSHIGSVVIFPRDSYKAQLGCQKTDCFRPSMYTVVTTEELKDVEVYSYDNIKRGILPVYRWYDLCDRHFMELDKSKVAPGLVEGPGTTASTELLKRLKERDENERREREQKSRARSVGGKGSSSTPSSGRSSTKSNSKRRDNGASKN